MISENEINIIGSNIEVRESPDLLLTLESSTLNRQSDIFSLTSIAEL